MNRDPSGAPVAAFDLDGTLISGHSLPRFVLGAAGPLRAVGAFGRAVPGALWSRSRGALKAGVLDRGLAARSAAEVHDAGERLARDLVADDLRAEVVAKADVHRAAGHQLVMVTAALDVYAVPVARRLGFDAVLSAVVEVVNGRCTGRIHDADLHGDAKVRALRSWLGDTERGCIVYAYGNSKDDDALLEFARATRQPCNDRFAPA